MKLWEDFKAWRRGEKRINTATRGRVYEKKEPTGARVVKMVPKIKLTQMKITRADGTQEVINHG